MAKDETCGNCQWWSTGGNEFFGKCRRSPPVYVGITRKDAGGIDRPLFLHPTTKPMDLCGEWEPEDE